LLAGCLFLGDLGDSQREQVAFAQLLAYPLRGVAFDDSFLFLAPGIDGCVFESPHLAGFVSPRA
jgi:hypothetical protein